jgi:hypothetical protein
VNKKRIGTNRIGSEAGKTEKGRALEPFFFIAALHKTEFTLLTQLVKRFVAMQQQSVLLRRRRTGQEA